MTGSAMSMGLPQGLAPLGPDMPVPGSATLTGKALGIGAGAGPMMPVGGIPMPASWFQPRPAFQTAPAAPAPGPAPAPRTASDPRRENRVGGNGGGQARDNSRDRAGASRGGTRSGMTGRDRSNFGH